MIEDHPAARRSPGGNFPRRNEKLRGLEKMKAYREKMESTFIENEGLLAQE